MEIEKFAEQIKNVALYSQKNEATLSGEVLANKEVALRLNSKMAQKILAISELTNMFRGKYSQVVAIDQQKVVDSYSYVDGWSVQQAIAAEGQTAVKEQQEAKKGLLDKVGF